MRTHPLRNLFYEIHFTSTRLIGKKNVSAVPYDIINLGFHNTLEGKKLEYDDDMTAYRAEVRKVDLAYRNHLGFNPIIGEETHKVPNPVRPPPFDAGKALTERSDRSRGF